jgi:predicted esterase
VVSALPAPPALPALPAVATDWCVAGTTGLDDETCYVVPAAARSRALVIYLSGIVPPTPTSPQKENVERIVHDAALAHGFTALLPRGRRGIGPPQARDWYAWPTTASDYAAYAPGMIAHWLEAKATLETALGRPFEHLYVAGSSSGAWFVVALAFNGALAADGWAAISGGAPGAWTAGDLVARTRVPFYVGYGSNDPTVAPGAHSLATVLRTAKWPVEEKVHPLGHGARAVYVEEAIAAWAR